VRASILTLLMVLAVGCKSVPTAVEKKLVENATQHAAISTLVARFYCENGKWPGSISEIQIYQSQKKLPLPVVVNWAWLESSEVKYEVGEQVVLRTPERNKEAGDIAVTSINSYPICDNGNVEIKIHLKLG
jgi:hypothetical protein